VYTLFWAILYVSQSATSPVLRNLWNVDTIYRSTKAVSKFGFLAFDGNDALWIKWVPLKNACYWQMNPSTGSKTKKGVKSCIKVLYKIHAFSWYYLDISCSVHHSSININLFPLDTQYIVSLIFYINPQHVSGSFAHHQEVSKMLSLSRLVLPFEMLVVGLATRYWFVWRYSYVTCQVLLHISPLCLKRRDFREKLIEHTKYFVFLYNFWFKHFSF
jgi:hypothetical protein